MNAIYIFDVDGTLTPARQKMTDEFYSFFRKWIIGKEVYFVSGSDYPKLLEQVPKDILESISGVFGCMGNSYYKHGKNVYEKTFEISDRLVFMLDQALRSTAWYPPCGNHIEKRVGMINFSVIGRNATQKQRKNYYLWDKEFCERERIVKEINENFVNFEAAVGGEISIDIFPTGWDKSQVLKIIPKGNYFFFGDRAYPGGNDFALAKILIDTNHMVYNVSSYEETWEILTCTHINQEESSEKISI